MSTATGRHRKPRHAPKAPKQPKIRKDRKPGMAFNMIELTLMILLGTVGVLMVLAARPFTHRGPRS
jgi:hypothetical protein